LHYYIPDYSRRGGLEDYAAAMDFASWLTRTRCVSIHGGFDSRGKEGNTNTWALIRRIVAKYEDLEHLRLNREGWGLHLAHIFKWLNAPNLKKLDIHGITKWKYGNAKLEIEVCVSVTVSVLEKRLQMKAHIDTKFD
jgi:hypothetical protein